MPAQALECYRTPQGHEPVTQWLESLTDQQARDAVRRGLQRLERGVPEHCCLLGDGLYEMCLDCGPGVRVYFGLLDTRVLLLLCGSCRLARAMERDSAFAFMQDFRSRQGTVA